MGDTAPEKSVGRSDDRSDKRGRSRRVDVSQQKKKGEGCCKMSIENVSAGFWRHPRLMLPPARGSLRKKKCSYRVFFASCRGIAARRDTTSDGQRLVYFLTERLCCCFFFILRRQNSWVERKAPPGAEAARNLGTRGRCTQGRGKERRLCCIKVRVHSKDRNRSVPACTELRRDHKKTRRKSRKE